MRRSFTAKFLEPSEIPRRMCAHLGSEGDLLFEDDVQESRKSGLARPHRRSSKPLHDVAKIGVAAR